MSISIRGSFSTSPGGYWGDSDIPGDVEDWEETAAEDAVSEMTDQLTGLTGKALYENMDAAPHLAEVLNLLTEDVEGLVDVDDTDWGSLPSNTRLKWDAAAKALGALAAWNLDTETIGEQAVERARDDRDRYAA